MKEENNSLNMAMVMALADACGISAKVFARSFKKNTISIDYLKEFTEECVNLELEDVKAKRIEKQEIKP